MRVLQVWRTRSTCVIRVSPECHREFQPSFTEVARAWTKVPEVDRDQHFFATIDFDDAMMVFQKVRFSSKVL